MQEADRYGNARIIGPKYEDVLIAKSSDKVIITCEKLVDDEVFVNNGDLVDISSVLVDYVVELPNGAKPGSCPEYYDIDREEMNTFLSTKNEDILTYIMESLEE